MFVEGMLGDGAVLAAIFTAGGDTVGRVGLWSGGLLAGSYFVRLALAWILLAVTRLGRPANRSDWRPRLASTAIRLAPQPGRARLLRWSGVALTTGVALAAGSTTASTSATAAEPLWPSLDRGVVQVAAPPVVRHFVERAPAVRPSVRSLRANPYQKPESKIRGSVVVRHGDTLWDIAARHLHGRRTNARIARAWPQWYRLNREVIGADPDLIITGLRLRIPSSSDEVTR